MRPHPTHEADAESWLGHRGIPALLRDAVADILMQLWEQAYQAGAGDTQPAQVVRDRVKRMASKWLSQVTQTRVQAIAGILAAGGAAAALIAAIKALLASAAAAALIAGTEVFRAFNTGLVDKYRNNRVARVRWVTRSGHPCPVCLANEADGPRHLGEPFSSGDSSPPAHPNCECVLLPADEE